MVVAAGEQVSRQTRVCLGSNRMVGLQEVLGNATGF